MAIYLKAVMSSLLMPRNSMERIIVDSIKLLGHDAPAVTPITIGCSLSMRPG